MSAGEALSTAAREMAGVVTLRLSPPLVYLLVTRRSGSRMKVAVAAGTCALAYLAFAHGPVPPGWLATGYLYLLGAACAIRTLPRYMREGRVSAGAVFTCCAVVFLVFPGAFWSPRMKAAVLIVGWDLVLSGYSYCVEVAKAEQDPNFGEFLFFLFVNPALVYARRGERVSAPAFHARAAARSIAGLVTMFASAAALVPVYSSARAAPASGVIGTTANLAACGGLRFLIEYCRQSGLASFQIGMMRQLGYRVPERFLWPLAARSLPEFWRRWNTYVGQWALRYVFWPMSLRLARSRASDWGRRLVTAGALVVTFAAVGGLHDAYVYVARATMQLRVTEAFVVAGALVVVWVALERLGERLELRLPVWSVRGLASVGRLCFWGALVGGMVRWWT